MKEIKPGVHFIKAENRGRYPYSNSLFLQGKENLLIDTGAGSFLKEISGKTEQVVLSHYHRDHVTFNHLFKEAAFSIHEDDAAGVESMAGFLNLSGLDQVDIKSSWKIVKQNVFPATKIDFRLRDGDYFDLGQLKVKVLHLPGHTPGHCGFLIENYNMVYASDIDLTRFGPWYGNASSDLNKFLESIRRLRGLKPQILITGHSLPTTENIDQKLGKFENIIEQRDEAIIAAIKERPATLKGLAHKNIIYHRHFGQEVLLFFEREMIRKHLESLLDKGMVTKTEDGCYEAL